MRGTNHQALVMDRLHAIVAMSAGIGGSMFPGTRQSGARCLPQAALELAWVLCAQLWAACHDMQNQAALGPRRC